MKKYNFIDLFAGCGGLSEGFYKQNFNALAHVEINPVACKTLRKCGRVCFGTRYYK